MLNKCIIISICCNCIATKSIAKMKVDEFCNGTSTVAECLLKFLEMFVFSKKNQLKFFNSPTIGNYAFSLHFNYRCSDFLKGSSDILDALKNCESSMFEPEVPNDMFPFDLPSTTIETSYEPTVIFNLLSLH